MFPLLRPELDSCPDDDEINNKPWDEKKSLGKGRRVDEAVDQFPGYICAPVKS
jgi:hypothetical protein